jgi:hypothetical protein
MGGFGMPLDVFVTEEDYIIHAVVPGLKAEAARPKVIKVKAK